MNRLPVAAMVAAGLVALTPSGASATGTMQRGTYKCYVFNAPGVPTYTGRSVKVVSAAKYSFFNGSQWKDGRYGHGSGAKITFRTGPLKGKAASHKVYGNGKHGIDVAMTPGVGGKYACSRS